MSYRSEILIDTPSVLHELDVKSGLSAPDVSGNGLTATIAATGVTYRQAGPIVSEPSYALLLDGATGTVSTVLTGHNPVYPFCLEAWVDPVSVSDGDTVVMLGDNGLEYLAWINVGPSGATWRLKIANGVFTRTVDGGAVTGGKQHLFARLVSATEHRLYVDSVLVATNTDSLAWSSPNSTLYAGSNFGINSFINASLSRTAFYNHDVTPARIAAHHAKALAVDNVLYRGVDAKLLDDATVLADTAGRIYADQMPDDPQMPGVRYALLTDTPHDRLSSGEHFTAELQLDVYARRGEESGAWTINEAARSALNRKDVPVLGFARVHALCTNRGTPFREGSFYRIRSQYRLFGNAA